MNNCLCIVPGVWRPEDPPKCIANYLTMVLVGGHGGRRVWWDAKARVGVQSRRLPCSLLSWHVCTSPNPCHPSQPSSIRGLGVVPQPIKVISEPHKSWLHRVLHVRHRRLAVERSCCALVDLHTVHLLCQHAAGTVLSSEMPRTAWHGHEQNGCSASLLSPGAPVFCPKAAPSEKWGGMANWGKMGHGPKYIMQSV